ncbi:MAG: exodeoxyribonuclease III [Dehalococcoidia bacterium]|nr:MAG: exodeoxyribonuclease III [Dehalococcoidia bacterium]
MTELRLVSWNVNGIRAAERKGFLDWLSGCEADIVAVQETKAHPDQLSPALINPPGYFSAWVAAEKKGYSGVATYSRELPKQIRAGLGDPRFDGEGRVLVTEFEPLTLFNIYFPNGGRGPEWVQHKLAFYDRFLEVIAPYLAEGRPLVVTGDVNTAFAEIDLARPKENSKTSGFLPEERQALARFFEAGLIDTFRHLRPHEVKYSWWDMRSFARQKGLGWRIDYFFVSPVLRDCIVDADIHCEVEGSDHAPVSLTLRL